MSHVSPVHEENLLCLFAVLSFFIHRVEDFDDVEFNPLLRTCTMMTNSTVLIIMFIRRWHYAFFIVMKRTHRTCLQHCFFSFKLQRTPMQFKIIKCSAHIWKWWTALFLVLHSYDADIACFSCAWREPVVPIHSTIFLHSNSRGL